MEATELPTPPHTWSAAASMNGHTAVREPHHLHRHTSTCSSVHPSVLSSIHSSIRPFTPTHRQAQRRPLACLFRSHVTFSGEPERRRLRSVLRPGGGSHSPLLPGGPALSLGLVLSRCPAAVPRFLSVIMDAEGRRKQLNPP